MFYIYQLIIAWWWIYCILVTVVYKSSLIAHLTFTGKSPALSTAEELVNAPGWSWGYEPLYGSGWEWLKQNSNPTIKTLYENIQVMLIILESRT